MSVMVPTVERGLLVRVFCSIEITGDSRNTKSTSGLVTCDEPLRIARQRFHVPALAFGVNRVERQAGFSRARKAGDDDEAVSRDLHRDVLEVVYARTLHGNRRAWCRFRAHRL